MNVQDTSEDILLCASHYQVLYRKLTMPIPLPCAACGATPKHGIYNRHCPNSTIINEHMNATLGINYTLDTTDVICYSCYRLHSTILKNFETQQQSCDSGLINIIAKLDERASVCDNRLSKAIIYIAKFVANELLQNKALLLPNVSRLFFEQYGANPHDMYSLQIEVGENIVKYSSRWLLHQLITELGIHLCYKCVHKKFGVILY